MRRRRSRRFVPGSAIRAAIRHPWHAGKHAPQEAVSCGSSADTVTTVGKRAPRERDACAARFLRAWADSLLAFAGYGSALFVVCELR